MATEPAENEHDADFLDYFERLGPQCKSITNLIDQKIAEALKATSTSGNDPANPSQSGNYLEKQNQMLLAELLKVKGLNPSTPEPHGEPSGAPGSTKPGPENEPTKPAKPARKPPFWG